MLGAPMAPGVLADHTVAEPLEFDPVTATVKYLPASDAVTTYCAPVVRFVHPAGCEEAAVATTELQACQR
jgi:hypothetical protein